MSGAAVVVCLVVAALLERRRRARPDAVQHVPAAPYGVAPAEPLAPPVPAWPAPAPVEPVWEDAAPVVDHAWPVEDEPVELPEEEELVVDEPAPVVPAPWGVEQLGYAPISPQPEVETETTVEEVPETEAVIEAEPLVEELPGIEEETPATEEAPPAPAPSHWFGSFAPAKPWAPSAARAEPAPDAADTDEHPAFTEGSSDEPAVAPAADEYGSVIELPAAPEQPEAQAHDEPRDPAAPSSGPRRLPPSHLRRFMGTGASVLVIALVLGAGVLVSGATADSTSDPSTVPNAVGTLADSGVVADGVSTPADTTATDTTATDTTTTDTTATDTTATDTTTTDTTTTSTDPTTTTDTTTTSTDPTTTTDTTTTSTDPATTTTAPTDTTVTAPVTTAPVTPDPATPVTPPAAPVDPAPAVTPPPAPPATSTPAVTPKPKAKVAPKKKAPVAPKAPAVSDQTSHATTRSTGSSHTSSATVPTGSPIVKLASGADPLGSILSTAIPAVDASLLPTPAQVRFYVRASKPLATLPTLTRIDHPLAERLVAAGRRAHVGWTVLAAVSRLESNFGAKPGLFAGRRLPTRPTGSGVAALAAYLHAHGAGSNPLTPLHSKKALTRYFGSARKANRAIALAALYGALGPFGLQHGVRAETARLQKRVLHDKRVHLTVAGKSDIRHGRVDPRVLVTLEYLANSFHKIGVSDLVSGGQLFSRSGAVSAHLYGRAADVSSLHGVKVKGHQGPGTLTEQAIRRLLLLPKALRPRQVISLMDVDGPTGNRGSFALPDHYDRIQIDY